MTGTRTRTWAATSARVVVGAAVAAAAVVGVVAGIAAPWPTVRAEPAAVSATPAPASAVVACDGPLIALGRTVEQADALSVAAPQAIVQGPSTTEAVSEVLTGPAGSTATALSAPPVGADRAELVASGSASIADPDLAGFAASACTPPLMESWLVGGSTATGANDLVVISNPGAVTASVELTVFGAAGPVAPPAGADRTVGPGAQIVLPLAGLLLDEESPVVRVTSTGAPVHASLQTSLTRVLTPGGVDQVGAVPAATTRQVMPGVSVLAAPDGANNATILRVLAPGEGGEATLTITPVEAATAASTSTLPLAAGVPTAVAFGDLAPGRYTVTVDATVPVVAGVWESTGFAEGSDFGWYAAAPEISAPSLVAVPAGPSPMLTIANAGDADARVVVEEADGANRNSVTVPAGESIAVPVTAEEIYRIIPESPVHAGLGFASANALAAFAVWASDAAAPPLTVYP